MPTTLFCRPCQYFNFVRSRCLRRACLSGFLLILAGIATAATYERVSVPDQRIDAGTPLVLNGIGLRTASIFDIGVYVAALYVEHPSADPDTILRSRERKRLELHFIHDVQANAARKAWLEGFARTCQAPCHLPEPDVAQFLAAVPSVHPGEVAVFTFGPDGVSVLLDELPIGKVTNPELAHVILAMFIGPAPASERLKRALLGRPG